MQVSLDNGEEFAALIWCRGILHGMEAGIFDIPRKDERAKLFTTSIKIGSRLFGIVLIYKNYLPYILFNQLK